MISQARWLTAAAFIQALCAIPDPSSMPHEDPRKLEAILTAFPQVVELYNIVPRVDPREVRAGISDLPLSKDQLLPIDSASYRGRAQVVEGLGMEITDAIEDASCAMSWAISPSSVEALKKGEEWKPDGPCGEKGPFTTLIFSESHQPGTEFPGRSGTEKECVIRAFMFTHTRMGIHDFLLSPRDEGGWEVIDHNEVYVVIS